MELKPLFSLYKSVAIPDWIIECNEQQYQQGITWGAMGEMLYRGIFEAINRNGFWMLYHFPVTPRIPMREMSGI